jgi:hypothetical protein
MGVWSLSLLMNQALQNAFHSADRSAHAGNPRETTEIKHPLGFLAKP